MVSSGVTSSYKTENFSCSSYEQISKPECKAFLVNGTNIRAIKKTFRKITQLRQISQIKFYNPTNEGN